MHAVPFLSNAVVAHAEDKTVVDEAIWALFVVQGFAYVVEVTRQAPTLQVLRALVRYE